MLYFLYDLNSFEQSGDFAKPDITAVIVGKISRGVHKPSIDDCPPKAPDRISAFAANNSFWSWHRNRVLKSD